MKINLLILFCLFVSCNTTNKQLPDNIITEEIFISVLKEAHLAEAAFELSKPKGVETAKKVLENTYSEIYLSYNIDKERFEETLSYYANHPEELEQIYSIVLKDLLQERTTLNP
jgi:hypothetical protein